MDNKEYFRFRLVCLFLFPISSQNGTQQGEALQIKVIENWPELGHLSVI